MINHSFKIVLVTFLLFGSIHAFADDHGYFSKEAKGWYWHDEYREPIDVEDENQQQVSADPLVELNAIRDRIERAKAQAVVNPTKENVRNYISIQNQLGEHAEEFEHVWKKVLLEHPDLDYSLKHPTNNIAKQVELNQQKQNEEAAIRKLAKQSGLFFFYRSSCPYCVRFAPIVKEFAESYGMVVIPITTDGIALPEFPNSYPDRGQAEKFKVKVEPALFAVNPYTHKAFPIAYGLTSEADLKKRIFDIVTHFGGV